jgi:hypothetical protein
LEPREPLVVRSDADFLVSVNVHLDFVKNALPQPRHQFWAVARSDFATEMQKQLLTPPSETERSHQIIIFNMTASKDEIELWWPNGMGAQPLYRIEVCILSDTETSSNDATVCTQKRIGTYLFLPSMLYPSRHQH